MTDGRTSGGAGNAACSDGQVGMDPTAADCELGQVKGTVRHRPMDRNMISWGTPCLHKTKWQRNTPLPFLCMGRSLAGHKFPSSIPFSRPFHGKCTTRERGGEGRRRRESNGVIYCVNLPMNANRIMYYGQGRRDESGPMGSWRRLEHFRGGVGVEAFIPFFFSIL